jgi:hypothetical protein
MSEVANIPLQIFLGGSFLFLGLSLVGLITTLIVKSQLKKDGKTTNNRLSVPLFEVEDLRTKRSSKKLVQLLFVLDVITAVFFCCFLIFFTVFSYLFWAWVFLLIFLFLLIFWGFYMTSFWLDLFTYLHEKFRHGSFRYYRLSKEMLRQMVLRQGVFVVLSAVIFLLVAYMTADICVLFQPFGLSTAFTRGFYRDPCTSDVPCFVYLTLGQNASTSVIVHFHSGKLYQAPVVLYDTTSHIGEPVQNYANVVQAIPYYVSPLRERTRYVYYGFLDNLIPNTDYFFIAGDGATNSSYSAERKFRTAPTIVTSAGFQFVVGGDMGLQPATYNLSRIAAAMEPLFAIVGGDIPYDQGMATCYPRDDAWLNLWQSTMVTPSGYTIPIIAAIGNHEAGGFVQDPSKVAYFRQYFVQEPLANVSSPTQLPTYHCHVIANFLVLALDSYVLVPPGGVQAQWIQNTLQSMASQVYWTSAVYHAPLYPSSRDPNAEPMKTLRETWGPIFDQQNLRISFENHDHAYKRTYLIRNNAIVSTNGTLYVGDGSWGVVPRVPVLRWYDQVIARENFFLYVNVSTAGLNVRAINLQGNIIDSFSLR